MSANPALAFEQPIRALEEQIEQLRSSPDSGTPESQDKLRAVRREWADITKTVYQNLTPWQRVQVARHPNRPQTSDYLGLLFDEFVELHGDRHFGDDRALLCGFAKLAGQKVMVVGHQKGRTVKERSACSFGCAHPEGYRKALLKVKLAAKFRIPVICLIDTPGAYPGIGAEERGQAQAIAENMFEMSRVETPIVCVVIGEGGSGGALGVGVGDRVAMLEHAYYSVISPEGCAGILWKSHKFAEKAAEALRFTSGDLLEFGVVDEIIPEPLGGAHRDHHQTAANVKRFLVQSLREIEGLDAVTLTDNRYQKFRQMGVFHEAG